MGIHGLQQAATAIHVHVPVMKWLLHRLSNRLQTGEMDHRINPRWRIGEGLLKIPRVAVAEIVEDNKLVARLQQYHRGMAADEACPTCISSFAIGLVTRGSHHQKADQCVALTPSIGLVVLP